MAQKTTFLGNVEDHPVSGKVPFGFGGGCDVGMYIGYPQGLYLVPPPPPDLIYYKLFVGGPGTPKTPVFLNPLPFWG